MTRRWLIATLCVTGPLWFTTSCPADEPAPSSPQVVRFWPSLGGSLGQAIQDQVDRFNASHTGIRVESENHGSYADTLRDYRQALAVGAQPDVALIEVHSVITLASRGQIGSLQALVDADRDFRPGDLVEATLKNLKWQGQLYGVPVNRSTPILYYNKQRFMAAGLDPAKPPQTWSEFRQAARKLTTNAESSYGFAVNPSTWQFEALVWSAGGKLLSDDGKKADFAAGGAGPLQLWADMIHRDKSARLAGREAFLSGQAAMLMESTALVASFQKSANFDIGTAFIPHDAGQQPGVPTGGGVAVIAPKLPPARQQAAWQLLKWLTATEQTADLSRKTGYVPVRKSAVELLTKEGFYKEHPNYKTAVDQMQYAREMPTVPAWPSAMGTIHTALRECLEQDKPAVDSLTAAATEVNRLLDRDGKKKQ